MDGKREGFKSRLSSLLKRHISIQSRYWHHHFYRHYFKKIRFAIQAQHPRAIRLLVIFFYQHLPAAIGNVFFKAGNIPVNLNLLPRS